MTFRSGTRSVCSPASRGTRGATLGPCQAVPLNSCRNGSALSSPRPRKPVAKREWTGMTASNPGPQRKRIAFPGIIVRLNFFNRDLFNAI